ncbi:peptidoglycan/xylan/chitin deacetylase (PgdA/CDA1 family) [Pedobacter cryoconitis]|uniref:Peptidoglycan/xylan/chitin deacetylase (PgdA/CDA1 family) n=1 Tax=Pedobacter cryoconitis TaxID=188932 RepID=A0A7W8ZL76_9SPHI|nr:polysaccharide deacetylase family protein [Pedobacter cryoconitis]MBB5636063.1 peptidoglycan/xylan/chitin deacetylase (PgdA/CDA1 family) [Pedobacter cryoconitis]MBB6273021.1 peptidoglycan/xylan/chitin deacetylase (PgdA/CDA1 family) [Pedobacter cryoconitis]
MYLVKSPLLLKWYYSSLVWNKSRHDKVVYLTFDDGPIPVVTEFVLNTLKSFNCKATFFCIGDNINKHAEIFEQVKNEGHAIGNHTFNHLKGWKTENKTYVQNFLDCQKLTKTDLFRPPYGRIKKSQIKEIRKINPQLNLIMWDVLSGDFDLNLSPEKCYENVIKNTRNGSIIVFHDSLKAFDRLKFALPAALKYLTAQGYKFHTL